MGMVATDGNTLAMCALHFWSVPTLRMSDVMLSKRWLANRLFLCIYIVQRQKQVKLIERKINAIKANEKHRAHTNIYANGRRSEKTEYKIERKKTSVRSEMILMNRIV